MPGIYCALPLPCEPAWGAGAFFFLLAKENKSKCLSQVGLMSPCIRCEGSRADDISWKGTTLLPGTQSPGLLGPPGQAYRSRGNSEPLAES